MADTSRPLRAAAIERLRRSTSCPMAVKQRTGDVAGQRPDHALALWTEGASLGQGNGANKAAGEDCPFGLSVLADADYAKAGACRRKSRACTGSRNGTRSHSTGPEADGTQVVRGRCVDAVKAHQLSSLGNDPGS